SCRTGPRGSSGACNVSSYGVFLPEAILVATALGSAVLGFAWRKRPDLLWAFSVIGTGLAIFITLDMMGLGIGRALNLSVWPSPVDTQGNFTAELKMKVDTFALFFQLMFAFVAFLAILASRGFIRPEEPHQGEYYALMLLAVVPFHMWAPDVYQGSPTTISVLLTSASKNVGIVALFRVFLIGLLSVQVDWVATLAILAIVTQTVGNIVAIPQRSIKRMLAYS